MTAPQAARLAEVTRGYSEDVDFKIIFGENGSIFAHVYALVYRIDKEGHGIILSRDDPVRIMNRF